MQFLRLILFSILTISSLHCNAALLLGLYTKIRTERRMDSIFNYTFQNYPHLDSTTILNNLKKYKLFRHKLNAFNRFDPYNMVNMSDDERANYWNEYKTHYVLRVPAIAYMTNSPENNIEAYNAALLSKGILLNATTTMSHIVNATEDSILHNNYSQYTSIRKQYNSLWKYYYDYTLDINSDSISNLQEKLSLKLDSLDNLLMKNLNYKSFLYSFKKRLSFKYTDIQACLTDSDAAIEFIQFDLPTNDTMYIALIITKSSKYPTMTPLFRASDIKTTEPHTYLNNQYLYDLIWKKITPHLYGIKNIYFSPDGILNDLAIEYAPDEYGLPINWAFNMYRLSSTRELIIAKPIKQKLNCLLIGGLNYSFNNNASGNLKNKRGAIEEASYLPGTLFEVNCIENVIKENNGYVTTIIGDNGTEHNFREHLNPSFNIIHIATHGFSSTDTTENSIISHLLYNYNTTKWTDNNFGLLMSGINESLYSPVQQNNSDNLLTADEISELDLSNVDLITLSACYTAVGNTYGLPNALKKAGVQSELVSLWSIDDVATSFFMRSFYTYYFKFKNKFQALRLAQQALCRFNGGKYNFPEYWGAFILIDGVEYLNNKYIDNIKYDIQEKDFNIKQIEYKRLSPTPKFGLR